MLKPIKLTHVRMKYLCYCVGNKYVYIETQVLSTQTKLTYQGGIWNTRLTQNSSIIDMQISKKITQSRSPIQHTKYQTPMWMETKGTWLRIQLWESSIPGGRVHTRWGILQQQQQQRRLSRVQYNYHPLCTGEWARQRRRTVAGAWSILAVHCWRQTVREAREDSMCRCHVTTWGTSTRRV